MALFICSDEWQKQFWDISSNIEKNRFSFLLREKPSNSWNGFNSNPLYTIAVVLDASSMLIMALTGDNNSNAIAVLDLDFENIHS